MDNYYSSYYLAHHGIKGMKWGIRRYQNEDGTLTDAGKARYSGGDELTKRDEKRFRTGKSAKSLSKALNRMDQEYAESYGRKREHEAQMNKYANKAVSRAAKKYGNDTEAVKNDKKYQKNLYKAADQAALAAKEIKRMERIEKEQNKTMAKAIENSFNVSVRKMKRSTLDRGKSTTSSLLLGPIGFIAYSSAKAKYGNPIVYEGNKFRVSKSKTGEGSLAFNNPEKYRTES